MGIGNGGRGVGRVGVGGRWGGLGWVGWGGVGFPFVNCSLRMVDLTTLLTTIVTH